MTLGKGEIRGRLDKVSSVTKTFIHTNGVNTELELWIGGKLGKLHLPVEVELITLGATYTLEYNEQDRDGSPMSDPITLTDWGAAGANYTIKIPACPHRLAASSTSGAVIICRY
jgi:hypothetical protein